MGGKAPNLRFIATNNVMDPLSIAASIAGLLTITGAILSTGYAHLSEAKNKDGDISSLLNEIASLSGILFGMKSQCDVSGQSKTPSPLWLAQDSAKAWGSTLQSCKKALTETKKLVNSLPTSNSTRLIIKEPSMTGRIDKLLL